MGRPGILLLLLIGLTLGLLACNSSASSSTLADDRDRQVLVALSVRDGRGQSAFVWLPGIALGDNRVAIFFDTSRSEAPDEVFVEWPDGSQSAAEVVAEEPAYRLVVLHAPGGVPYPPLPALAPEAKQGDELVVRAYASPWYQTVVTQEPRLEPGVRDTIPPLTETPATVVSSGAPMSPQLAKDEEALFLALKVERPTAGNTPVMAGGMVLRGVRLVGVVSVASNLGDVWAVPSSVLRGAEARAGSPLPAAGGQAAGEKVYNRSIRRGPLEMVLWRTNQSGTGFTVQLRLQNHSSQPLVLAHTEDLGAQRRDQHSPVFLLTEGETRVAPVSFGFDTATQAGAGAVEDRRGPPPVWFIEPNREQMVAHFTFPTAPKDAEKAVFRWTGISAEGSDTAYEFEFALTR